MFGSKLDRIVSTFTKVSQKLDSLIDSHAKDIDIIDEGIDVAKGMRNEKVDERNKAIAIKKKIDALVS